jgi:hypothetical protein
MVTVERLKILIKEFSKSERDFSLKLGINPATLNLYMLGRRKISLEVVESILDIYPNVSAEWLLRGIGEMLLYEEERLDYSKCLRDGCTNEQSDTTYKTFDVKGKIKEYLKFMRISPSSAERILGWGVGSFTKPKSITVDRAKDFLHIFNNLSAEWLLRDKGNMILRFKNNGDIEESIIDEKFLKQIIEEQIDTINMLKKRLSEFEKESDKNETNITTL